MVAVAGFFLQLVQNGINSIKEELINPENMITLINDCQEGFKMSDKHLEEHKKA